MLALILYVLGFVHFLLEVNRLNEQEVMLAKRPGVDEKRKARKLRMYSPSFINALAMVFFAAAWPFIVVLDIVNTLRGAK